jgi:hypothetical protein
MRQASWIAFLLLALGLVSYEAALDQQDQQTETVEQSLDGGGGIFPEPKP